MPSYILVGDEKYCDDYIKNFQISNKISDYDTITYKDKILIDDSKKVIKSLNFKTNDRKLIIFKNEITIEAQNSLLKNIEELESFYNIIICTHNLNTLLPTMHSRCFIIDLRKIEEKTGLQNDILRNFFNGKMGMWELVENLENIEKPAFFLMNELRELLIDPSFVQKKKAYIFAKKLLRIYPLVQNNNVNFKIAIEKTLTN